MAGPSRWSNVRNGTCAVLRSRPMRLLGVLLLLGGLVVAFRVPILRGLGAFLITADEACPVDAVYVLGGAADYRGQEAGAVYKAGWARRFRFTGGSVPTSLKVEGILRTEAQQTRDEAVRSGVPDSLAVALHRGTSTWEEAQVILADARAAGFDTVMIVSSRFHLRRIRHVFRDRFREAGITVVLHGAPNGAFTDDRWWDSEEGLLMVNNEYVKLIYYLLKY